MSESALHLGLLQAEVVVLVHAHKLKRTLLQHPQLLILAAARTK